MSAKAQRSRNKVIKLVGGGTRRRHADAKGAGRGGSLKSQRRAIRQAMKAGDRGKLRAMGLADYRAVKLRLKELLAQKDGR